MMGLPGIRLIASVIILGSVESITNGASISRLSLLTSFFINSSSSDLSVVATQTSIQCAPSCTCPLPRSIRPSKSSANTSFFAFFEPCVFKRSPIINGGGICTKSTAFNAELTRGTCFNSI